MPVPGDWAEQQKAIMNEYENELDPFGKFYDQLFSKLVWTDTASSWNEFEVWLTELNGSWCFRGQRDASWALRPSLDRAVRVVTPHGYYHLAPKPEEDELLFKFQQQAHQFIPNVPDADDRASWSALMQHHGVPTRFLDWTRSPYVALYFSIEEASQNIVRNPAIFAIDMQWLETKEKEYLGIVPRNPRGRTEYLNNLLEQSGKPLIVQINPPQANERMFAQQGFFLWKLIAQVPAFDQILISMMKDPSDAQPVIRKLEIKEHLRIEFLRNLRKMNIHKASLFPGLDGFCQSLKLDLEIKVANEAETTAKLEKAHQDALVDSRI